MKRLLALSLAGFVGCASPSSQSEVSDAAYAEARGDAGDVTAADATDATVEMTHEDAGADDAGDDGATSAGEDGSGPHATTPAGLAYAESEYSLRKPAALSALLGQARQLVGQGRLFVNAYSSAGDNVTIEYGAADPAPAEALRFQFPEAMRSRFHAAPLPEQPATYRSEPFTYRLLARVSVLLQEQYVSMILRDVVYMASFDEGFHAILEGSLHGALTRREAESSAFERGLACSAYCPLAYCTSHGVSALSDLLDCQGAALDLDRNGDGTLDAYRVELSFASRRITLSDH